MVVNLGFGLLVIALVSSLYGVGAAIYGWARKAEDWIKSARISAFIGFPLLTCVVALLEILILIGRYDVAYVYEVSNSTMPTYLKITALWGGQAGSLLFWCWLTSLFLFVYVLKKRNADDRMPWMIAIPQFTVAFFLFMIIFSSNPFNRMFIGMNGNQILSVFQPGNTLAVQPDEGVGLNPLLRHPGMVLHPPLLYLGFIGFVIPFSAAIAELINKKNDFRWLKEMRVWILVSWLFLFAGLLLGSRWAYDVLGWGGYWGWDPVEIAALMPWLSATALLHTMLLQEHGGKGKRWNVILIMITFLLVIFGTFVTRSGLISSVHAFSESSIGYYLLGFILFCLTGCIMLLLMRWKELKPSEHDDGLLSRQTVFQVVNLLFLGILAVCLWGVIYPTLAQAIAKQSVTVGPSYYKAASGPLFAALLLLMGICPLLAWARSTMRALGKQILLPALVTVAVTVAIIISGVHNWVAVLSFAFVAFSATSTLYDYIRASWLRHKSTQENVLRSFWSLAAINRKRYGGYIIHLGVILMASGIIGIEFFQTQAEKNIKKGESIEFAGYTIQNNEIQFADVKDGRSTALADITISKNDHPLGKLYPHMDYYFTMDQTVTIPAVFSNLKEDLYIVLAGASSDQIATVKIYHNPLINWLWIGGIVLMFGTVVAVLPQRSVILQRRTRSNPRKAV
jgi:cytochrome c-type biogenesis protein CcmF